MANELDALEANYVELADTTGETFESIANRVESAGGSNALVARLRARVTAPSDVPVGRSSSKPDQQTA